MLSICSLHFNHEQPIVRCTVGCSAVVVSHVVLHTCGILIAVLEPPHVALQVYQCWLAWLVPTQLHCGSLISMNNVSCQARVCPLTTKLTQVRLAPDKHGITRG